MSIRRVRVAPVMLENLLRGKIEPCDSTAPADLQVIGGAFDPLEFVFVFLVQSDSFDSFAEGDVPPEWIPTFTRIQS